MEMDVSLYERCARENTDKIRLKDLEREAADVRWSVLIAAAAAKGVFVNA